MTQTNKGITLEPLPNPIRVHVLLVYVYIIMPIYHCLSIILRWACLPIAMGRIRGLLIVSSEMCTVNLDVMMCAFLQRVRTCMTTSYTMQ